MMKLLLLALVLSGCTIRISDERGVSRDELAKAFSDRDDVLKLVGKVLEKQEAQIKALEQKK